ncbi:MAG: SLBB domain-containing protein, partial [Jaaginema sp. PMC 1079.18]|nr:SLBB domain-containing protein [Jaaginema sp. PMC 1079.18]
EIPLTPPPDFTTPPASTSLDSVYLLGGGDRLSVDIFEVPQYSGEYQVPVDGVIYFPLIGAVRIGGLTIQQASEAISQQYSQYLKRPIVTIRLLNTRPLNIFVSGEVANAGTFTIDLIGGAGDNPGVQFPTLGQALKAAGGVTLAADLQNIQVTRRLSGGDTTLYRINLEQLLQSGVQGQDLAVRDGDSIYVPAATEIDLRRLRQLATLDFAANTSKGRTVSVVGEVERPGSYYLQIASPGVEGTLPTVTRALQEAGGITPLADVRNVQIRRLTKAGTEQLIAINLWELLQIGDTTQDTVLQDGDTIIIPEANDLSAAEATELATARFSPDTIQVSVIGEVDDPGIVNLPPNTPMNQALMTAGGFDRARADNDVVRLIRLNPDGSVVSREVPIDITQGISEQSNPLLRNNDIIVVSRNRGTAFSDTVNNLLSTGSNVLAWLSVPSRIFSILDVLGIIDLDGNSN